MDWWEQAYEACAEEHLPEEWEGREWDDLTDKERDDVINDHIRGRADYLRDV